MTEIDRKKSWKAFVSYFPFIFYYIIYNNQF
jgi:hypothetical protein